MTIWTGDPVHEATGPLLYAAGIGVGKLVGEIVGILVGKFVGEELGEAE